MALPISSQSRHHDSDSDSNDDDNKNPAPKTRPDSGYRVLDARHLPTIMRYFGGHPTCHFCEAPLKMGDEYYSMPSGRRRRKYYHTACWERVSNAAGQ